MDQSDCIDFGILAILEGLLTRIFYMLCLIYYIVKTCLRRSATGNYKSGLCWQVAFVQKVRNYFSIFTGRIKTGNHYSQVSLCTGL